jgi:hypothetical protein
MCSSRQQCILSSGKGREGIAVQPARKNATKKGETNWSQNSHVSINFLNTVHTKKQKWIQNTISSITDMGNPLETIGSEKGF